MSFAEILARLLTTAGFGELVFYWLEVGNDFFPSFLVQFPSHPVRISFDQQLVPMELRIVDELLNPFGGFAIR